MDNPFANIDVSNNADDDIEYLSNQNQNNKDTCIPIEFHSDSVSAVNQCQSEKARKLCIFNLDRKLQHSDQYDIGGTYTKIRPDLWFYCTTTKCLDASHILNLFVCHRNVGIFSVSISENKSFTTEKTKDPFSFYLLMTNRLTTKTFNSAKIDQSHFIASYCFTSEDLATMENKTLCIPIEIKINPKCPINKDILMDIKARHRLSNIFKRHENTDFVLQSTSGKNYDTHKIILATQSPVLKEIIRDNMSTNSASVDVSDVEMDLLLEFMYTGTVKTLMDENLNQLLDIAHKFKLENLNLLTQHVITQKITVKNAVDIALLTEKYQLDSIQKTVFEFIKRSPQVLETEGWRNLNDVALTKKLFKEIYAGNGQL